MREPYTRCGYYVFHHKKKYSAEIEIYQCSLKTNHAGECNFIDAKNRAIPGKILRELADKSHGLCGLAIGFL